MTKQPTNQLTDILPCAVILLLGVLTIPCSAQTDSGYALMVQKTPVDGGTVTPGIGIHKFEINQMVTLMAIPKVGYRFLFWLGDVTDTSSNETSVWLNSPKIVVAVFERTEFELPEGSGVVGGVGLDEAMNHYADIHMGPGISGGSYGGGAKYYPPGTPETPENPIPEPTTLALLGIGAAWISKRRRG